jgi:hypothetical protein
MSYRFSRIVTFEEKITTFCQVVSLYDNEIIITDNFAFQQGVEYAIVLPK